MSGPCSLPADGVHRVLDRIARQLGAVEEALVPALAASADPALLRALQGLDDSTQGLSGLVRLAEQASQEETVAPRAVFPTDWADLYAGEVFQQTCASGALDIL